MQSFVCTCIPAVIIFKESYCGGKLRLREREREQETKVNVYSYESPIGYGQAMTMIN